MPESHSWSHSQKGKLWEVSLKLSSGVFSSSLGCLSSLPCSLTCCTTFRAFHSLVSHAVQIIWTCCSLCLFLQVCSCYLFGYSYFLTTSASLRHPLSQPVRFLMFRFTFLFFKVIYFVYDCTCVQHTVIHVERPEDNLWGQLTWLLRVELKSSGLKARAFTHWAVLALLPHPRSVFVCLFAFLRQGLTGL